MILGKNFQQTAQLDIEEFDAVQESYELAEIMLESTKDATMLESALYIADIILEDTALSGEDVEIALEATFKETLDNIVKSIQNFLKSIGAFFNKMGAAAKLLVTSGEKFISKYEAQIKDAAAKAEGFKYQMPKYDLALFKEEAGSIDKFTANPETLSAETDDKKTTEDFMKKFKGEKVNYTEVATIETMIEFIKNGKTIIEDINKTQASVKEINDKLIKECQEAIGKKDQDVAKYTEKSKKVSKLSNAMINHVKKVKNAYFDASADFEACLKKLLLYKNKKTEKEPEKAQETPAGEPGSKSQPLIGVVESASLLDTALKFIR